MPLATRDGVSLHYAEQGAGEPVLVIMGLGGDHLWWEPQFAAFSQRHRALFVDNRGTGKSDKPAGRYTTAMMADDAAAVLEAAGIERAHVVGLSMGGMIAQELALRHPGRVGTLVLASTYAKPDAGVERAAEAAAESSGAPPLREGLAMLESGKLDLSGVDVKQMFKLMMSMVLTPEYIAANKLTLKANLQRAFDSGTTIDHFLAHVHAVMHHDSSARLPTLRLPTLVLTGDADKLVPPHLSDALARLIPGARLHKIAGGTHGVNVERPDEWSRLVLDFLAEHPL